MTENSGKCESVMRFLARGFAVGGLLAITGTTSAQTIVKPIAPVKTSGGVLAGQALSSGVKAWLGIPFAKPPVGNLRWAPPQPMTWRGIWNADRTGPECMQVLRPHNINHYFGEEPTSENCLTMNIWAPPGAKAGARLPVVVFIYGGGMTIGSSGMANYNGEKMAKAGAVFVNFNYRVGLLGFMAHPELTREQDGHSGNYGYLDQNAALRWVQANIAQFGGDPGKVLVGGQSAGASSVVQQMFSPLSKGLFRAAFASSGCNFTAPDTPLEQGEAVGIEAQKRLGLASIDEMRQVPADRIIALQAESQVGLNVPGLRASAVVDGWFMPKPKADILAAHEMNDVPLIAHFNADEGMHPLASVKTPEEYRELVEKMYGDHAAGFLALYPVPTQENLRAATNRAAREAGLESQARTCARLKSRYGGAPVYLSMYSRKHPYVPGVRIADQDIATVGAYHTADIPYWFGTQDAFNSLRHTRDWTPWDRRLSQAMMGALIHFAASGNPETPAFRWPAWSAAAERKVVFGNEIGLVDLDVKALDWLAAYPAANVTSGPPAPVRARD